MNLNVSGVLINSLGILTFILVKFGENPESFEALSETFDSDQFPRLNTSITSVDWFFVDVNGIEIIPCDISVSGSSIVPIRVPNPLSSSNGLGYNKNHHMIE